MPQEDFSVIDNSYFLYEHKTFKQKWSEVAEYSAASAQFSIGSAITKTSLIDQHSK